MYWRIRLHVNELATRYESTTMEPGQRCKTEADANSKTGIRIILVDDHPAVRQGLALLFTQAGHTICAEAENRTEALAYFDASHADMAIVDLSLGDESGLDLIANLRERGVPVLTYSMHEDFETIEKAFGAGANGYVSKREASEVLLGAAQAILKGLRFISPRAAQSLAASVLPPQDINGVLPLSERETQIMHMLGQGDSNAEIAGSLAISVRTVESYYARIIDKLGIDGMKELRKYAIRNK
jgi:DNA-binding NarL/FixJ family response regulator